VDNHPAYYHLAVRKHHVDNAERHEIDSAVAVAAAGDAGAKADGGDGGV